MGLLIIQYFKQHQASFLKFHDSGDNRCIWLKSPLHFLGWVQNDNISPLTRSCLKYDDRRPGGGHPSLICLLACLHLANPFGWPPLRGFSWYHFRLLIWLITFGSLDNSSVILEGSHTNHGKIPQASYHVWKFNASIIRNWYYRGPIHTSCCCRVELIIIRCSTSTAFSAFDSYVEPNLSNLITNQMEKYPKHPIMFENLMHPLSGIDSTEAQFIHRAAAVSNLLLLGAAPARLFLSLIHTLNLICRT